MNERGKENMVIHGGQLLCCLARCSHRLFPLVSFICFFLLRVKSGGTGFYIPCTLTHVTSNGRETENVRQVNGRRKCWAGLVWICTGCLTLSPFHTDRSDPCAPNQTEIQFHCIVSGNNFLFQVVNKAPAVLNYPF